MFIHYLSNNTTVYSFRLETNGKFWGLLLNINLNGRNPKLLTEDAWLYNKVNKISIRKVAKYLEL